MQHALAFDTLAYAKKLKSVGVSEEQAEIQAETLAELVNENLSTKNDLKELEITLKRDIKELETTLKRDIEELRRDMKELETTLKRDMKELEIRLLIRLGVMLVASIGIFSTLITLLR